MKIAGRIIAWLLVSLSCLAGAAHAASLTLVVQPPGTTTVVQNNPFAVALQMNAQDLAEDPDDYYGGKIVITFDITKLTYGGFVLSPGLSFFSNEVIATNGNTRTVTFGFDNAAPLGPVGTFSFTAIGSAGVLASIGLADADTFPGGSFYEYSDGPPQFGGYTPFVPVFNPAQVNIVPLPAGVWLLGTGLVGLLARRRLQRASS